jgi:outer membrane lipoprotein carrier protein
MAPENIRLIGRSNPIFPLIRPLGKGIHRAVEKVVDNAVHNFCNSSNVTIFYHFAQWVGIYMFNDFNLLQNHRAIPAIYSFLGPGYKPASKFVPSLRRPQVLFSSRKKRIAGARMAAFSLVLLPWIALFCSPIPAAASEILSLEQLTAKTQEVYDKTTDLKARFVQEVTIKSMRKTDREEGTVWIKNPKMMLWEYDKPKEKRLVINARTAWLYVAEDRMVYVQNAEDVFRSRMAVKFLSGIGKLSDDFQLRFSKDGPTDEEGNYLLTLTAKEKGTGIDRLHLTIGDKSFLILQCRFNDAYGNTTILRFSDIRTNTGVSDKFFTFKPPAGVEEVKMP